MAKEDAYNWLNEHSDKWKQSGRCKLWTGATNTKGYPIMKLEGKSKLVHRHVLELCLGRPIGVDMHCAHTCANRHCIAPQHLYEATQSENEQDKHNGKN